MTIWTFWKMEILSGKSINLPGLWLREEEEGINRMNGTVAHQAPLFMGFPRQEYWSGFPFPSPGHLPNPGIEPWSPVGEFFTI